MKLTIKVTRGILGGVLIAYAIYVLLIVASFAGTAIGNAIG